MTHTLSLSRCHSTAAASEDFWPPAGSPLLYLRLPLRRFPLLLLPLQVSPPRRPLSPRAKSSRIPSQILIYHPGLPWSSLT